MEKKITFKEGQYTFSLLSGASIIFIKSSEYSKSKFGVDMDTSMASKLWNSPFDFKLGLNTSVNSETKIEMIPYFGVNVNLAKWRNPF